LGVERCPVPAPYSGVLLSTEDLGFPGNGASRATYKHETIASVSCGHDHNGKDVDLEIILHCTFWYMRLVLGVMHREVAMT
jgi:hypothetical protein